MNIQNNVIDPIKIFEQWYLEAKEKEINNPNACCLATADSLGYPSARMVLIKTFDNRGFSFYTNLNSRKAQDLSRNVKAALCFHWKSTGKQVRVEGPVIDIPNSEADNYFKSRHRESQIGAWVSKQSSFLSTGLSKLDQEFNREKERIGNKEVARPHFWSGKIVVPEKIEFWKSRASRLHERILFTAYKDEWKKEYLYP